MFTGGRDAGRVSPEQASSRAACCSASSGGGWEAGFWPAQGAEKAGGLKTDNLRDSPATAGDGGAAPGGPGCGTPPRKGALKRSGNPRSRAGADVGRLPSPCERRPTGQAGSGRSAATSTSHPNVKRRHARDTDRTVSCPWERPVESIEDFT